MAAQPSDRKIQPLSAAPPHTHRGSVHIQGEEPTATALEGFEELPPVQVRRRRRKKVPAAAPHARLARSSVPQRCHTPTQVADLGQLRQTARRSSKHMSYTYRELEVSMTCSVAPPARLSSAPRLVLRRPSALLLCCTAANANHRRHRRHHRYRRHRRPSLCRCRWPSPRGCS